MYTELRRALKTAKIDQYELANWLGVSASAVSNRMAGKTRWPLDDCYKALAYLGREPEDIALLFPPDGKTRPTPASEPPASSLATLRDACLAVAAAISV